MVIQESDASQYRARDDMTNGIAGGFVTGGILARNSGPKGTLMGAVGFAMFSAAIEMFLRRETREYVFHLRSRRCILTSSTVTTDIYLIVYLTAWCPISVLFKINRPRLRWMKNSTTVRVRCPLSRLFGTFSCRLLNLLCPSIQRRS